MKNRVLIIDATTRKIVDVRNSRGSPINAPGARPHRAAGLLLARTRSLFGDNVPLEPTAFSSRQE
jgi:hypothetical protein